MKNLVKTLALIILTITLFSMCTSCNNNNKVCNGYCSKLRINDKNQTVIRLQQQWFPNSGFAGEIFAKNQTDSIYGLDIRIIPGSDQIDTKQVVKLGEAEFGVAGAEQIMQANEKGGDFVVIGVINYKSLACFISKKEKNILTPKDMEGHKIGTMEGSPVDLIYKTLKEKEKLNIRKSDEIPTQWVLTGFIRDEYDVYPAFINDEPITLNAQNIKLNIIQPSNYDINFIGTVYFCKRELVECCPDIVQKFVNSISQGWELALKNPKQAIKLLKQYDKNIDSDKELKSLISGMEYFKGENGRMLYAKEETWKNMAYLLKKINQINKFDFNKTVNTSFVTNYLTETKKKYNENVKK